MFIGSFAIIFAGQAGANHHEYGIQPEVSARTTVATVFNHDAMA
jgi:hypothetical protein